MRWLDFSVVLLRRNIARLPHSPVSAISPKRAIPERSTLREPSVRGVTPLAAGPWRSRTRSESAFPPSCVSLSNRSETRGRDNRDVPGQDPGGGSPCSLPPRGGQKGPPAPPAAGAPAPAPRSEAARPPGPARGRGARRRAGEERRAALGPARRPRGHCLRAPAEGGVGRRRGLASRARPFAPCRRASAARLHAPTCGGAPGRGAGPRTSGGRRRGRPRAR